MDFDSTTKFNLHFVTWILNKSLKNSQLFFQVGSPDSKSLERHKARKSAPQMSGMLEIVSQQSHSVRTGHGLVEIWFKSCRFIVVQQVNR